MWRKAMHYLGLGPDEEYDDYDPSYEEPAAQQPAPQPRYAPQQAPQPQQYEEPSAIGSVRPMVSPQRAERREPVRVDPGPQPLQRPRPQVVRTMPVTASAKPQVVVPTSFNQAQEIADKFKGSQPVIVNMQSADRDLARRLIDFASGLCYGLGGQMEKVANQVYLLTPSNVEVSAEDRRRLQERNYDH
jgi:cell division inhibitor SepF